MILGAADPDDLDMEDSGLSSGIGALDIPQGVTLIRTTPQVAATVLSNELTEPEALIGQRLRANPSLFVDGYLPADWVLMPRNWTALMLSCLRPMSCRSMCPVAGRPH